MSGQKAPKQSRLVTAAVYVGGALLMLLFWGGVAAMYTGKSYLQGVWVMFQIGVGNVVLWSAILLVMGLLIVAYERRWVRRSHDQADRQALEGFVVIECRHCKSHVAKFDAVVVSSIDGPYWCCSQCFDSALKKSATESAGLQRWESRHTT
jgi:membrane protein implicated in regulation of membrane protease activity